MKMHEIWEEMCVCVCVCMSVCMCVITERNARESRKMHEIR